jgi:hypothetical protein
LMYALFTAVRFDADQGGEDRAVQVLHDALIPQIKQVPGFVKGTWFGNETVGHGLFLFETEEQARQAVQPVDSNMFGTIVVSSDVYRVHGEA